MKFYISSSVKSNSVKASFMLNNLLVAVKVSSLQIYSSSLVLLVEIPIQGVIVNCLKQDDCIIVVLKNQLVKLRLNQNLIVETISTADTTDLGSKPCEKQIVRANSNLIALSKSHGLMKFIENDLVYNSRLDVLDVTDFILLDKNDLLVLHKNVKQQYVLTFMTLSKKDLKTIHELRLSEHGLFLIKLAQNEFILVCQQSISYYQSNLKKYSIFIKPTIMTNYTKIDDTRYLLSDNSGDMYILVIKDKLYCSKIGSSCQASSLTYLSDGLVYAASHFGDSKLVKLNSVGDPMDCVSVVEEFQSLSPITDFCVVNEKSSEVSNGALQLLSSQTQTTSQIVACCGASKEGSLKIIRNGVGIEELGSLNCEFLFDVFSLESGLTDKWLLFSFVSETRIQCMTGDLEFQEMRGDYGFRKNCATLVAKNTSAGIIQVTPYEVLCLDAKSLELAARYVYSSSNTEQINCADAQGNEVLICAGQLLILLHFSNGKFVELRRTTLEYQVSCLSLSSGHIAIGLWEENSVQLLQHDFSRLFKTVLIQSSSPYSILLAEIESQPYLLVSLTDGSLCYTPITEHADLQFKKTILGSLPITFKPFTSESQTLIFCSCDKPTLIYGKSGRLLFSSVNLDSVYAMTSFNESLALVTSSGLLLTKLDTIQKIHVKKVNVGLTCRRIVYDSMSYIVVCEEGNSCKLRLYSTGFDILDEYQMQKYELAVSLIKVNLAQTFIVVGTGLALPDEDEPKCGRLLLFSIEGGRLELFGELEMPGCVYSIASIGDSLIAAVNASVMVVRYNQDQNALEVFDTHYGHVLALALAVKGDIVIVGDLMKSICMLHYNSETFKLSLFARDYETRWITALETIDDRVVIGDSQRNVVVLVKDPNSKKMIVDAKFHLGDMVNRFRAGILIYNIGSIVMRAGDLPTAATPVLLFGTVHGTLGVLATLKDENFVILDKLQVEMGKLPSVGNLSNQEYRSFADDRSKSKSAGFIDGDFVEKFVDLSSENQATVAEGVGTSVQQLSELIQDLTHIH